MLLRFMCAAFLAFLLCGCNGWAAETPLIPIAERDPVGLSGAYVADGNEVIVTRGDDGTYLVVEPGSGDPARAVAFDLLREEKPREGDLPDRTYLIEVPVSSDSGRVAYFYQIVRTGGGEGWQSGSFANFRVLCSKSTQAFAAKVEEGVCIFDDYAQLRAAAFDALAWYDDARMEVEITAYARRTDEFDQEGAQP